MEQKFINAFIPIEGSIFSSITQVCVATYKKHHLQDPTNEKGGVYHDPLLEDDISLKMHLSKKLSNVSQPYISILIFNPPIQYKLLGNYVINKLHDSF